jgi:hypothetical protein
MMTPLTPLQQIQSLYHQLNSADRKKLRMFMDALPGGKGASLMAPMPNDDWLLTGILYELSRRGMKYRHEIVPEGNYAEDSEIVRSELTRLLGISIPDLKYVEQLALGKLVAKALANYLVNKKLNLGLKVMLNNVGKSLEAIDASFPGYLASGVAVGFLVKRG